jgi:hypothetical protein
MIDTYINTYNPIFETLHEFYREYFYCVDRVHDSALHGYRCAACREAHTNFADELVWLMADNVWNEGK